MNDALATPRKTLGRYEILGEIARGAMGVVYKARDPLIDRMVAIKTVDIGLSSAEMEAFERRFFREAKSAGRLNHPNVVIIHDVGKTDDVAYIAMEFLDGRSLREILDSGVVLPPQRIADITAEIAEGLAFAHRNGVVHRDVKPANVMVLASGAVKITDFGIALLPTGTRTMTGNVFGSPRYTSPEQVMGRPVDGRSDIFSLGAVLYEMLTGKPPFQGNDLNSILKQVLSEPTASPTSHNPKLPRAFDHIIAKALAKDPRDRYQDADEMAHDLRHFDTIEFASPAPSPLPGLEHPTHPSGVPAAEPGADEAMLGASDAGVVPPAPSAWWRRPPAIAGFAVAAAAIVLVFAMRPREPAPPVASAPEPARAATASSGTIAGAPAATSVAAPEPAVKPPALGPATPPSATPPAAPAAAVAAAPPKPMGRVALAVTPWGEVYVDGRKRGVSPPMQELRVTPGKHVVEIRNTTFPPFQDTVDVAADGVVRIKHKFP
ncbi:MAG TPA: protein kinase [Casimicrobiaceae bacterium]|nr:protein kinase [Casimicrobiaceae bacterium]